MHEKLRPVGGARREGRRTVHASLVFNSQKRKQFRTRPALSKEELKTLYKN